MQGGVGVTLRIQGFRIVEFEKIPPELRKPKKKTEFVEFKDEKCAISNFERYLHSAVNQELRITR